jgi:AcrR family transcriptional regulator
MASTALCDHDSSRVLEVTAHLMFERGVADTTIEDIKAAAGVSASQIYHYLGDREGLVRAVISYQTDLTLDRQRPLIDHADPYDPDIMNPIYYSGDNLHPNDAGYVAMGNAINLAMLLHT